MGSPHRALPHTVPIGQEATEVMVQVLEGALGRKAWGMAGEKGSECVHPAEDSGQGESLKGVEFISWKWFLPAELRDLGTCLGILGAT